MSPPRHLWSGDWQRDSEAAARERANRGLSVPDAEPERLVPAPPGPRMRVRVRAWLSGILRGSRARAPRLRFMVLVALAALVVVGAAYGVSSIGRADSGSAVAGHAPWLGLEMGILSSGAVVVSSVDPAGPAAAAGLKTGDVILQFDGRPVVTPIDVTEGVDALLPGETVDLQVQRGSATDLVQAKLAARPVPSP